MKKIDEQSHKLHPRLRVIRNGDQNVNAILATLSQTVASAVPLQAEERPVAEILQQSLGESLNYASQPEQQRPIRRLAKRPKLEDQPASTGAYVNVFLEFHRELPGWSSADIESAIAALREQVAASAQNAPNLSAGAPLKRRNLMSATVPVTLLDEVSRDPVVAFVHQAESLKLSVPLAEPAPRKAQSRAIGTAAKHGRGKGVLIGIVDVDGFGSPTLTFSGRMGRRGSSRSGTRVATSASRRTPSATAPSLRRRTSTRRSRQPSSLGCRQRR